MHCQPIYKKMKIFNKVKYSVSKKISEKGFYIPSGIGITRKEQDLVISQLLKIFK
jgi:perosamine synthetase